MRLDEVLNATSGIYFEGTLIDALQTPYQLIEVFDTPNLGKLMRIDGANMTSEGDEFFYHENLVHPAAITHPAPRSVLIIGGGDGGSSEEILKHPSVERVVLVELDQGVIDMAKKHLSAIHRNVFADPKLDLRILDGETFVRTTKAQFDLIYLDLTDPAGPAAELYTPSFYAELKRALAPGGALVLHIGSPFSHPDRVRNSLAHLQAVYARVTPYFVQIPTYGSAWGFVVAAESLDPRELTAVDVNRCLQDRAIADRQFYNAETHHAMMALPEYVKNLIA